MILAHRTVEGIDIVALSGRLVMADVPEVRRRLLQIVEQGSGKLVLNLEGVGFMDSSGLSVLVSVLKSARIKNGEVVLLGLTPIVRSLIELTRLQQIFEIFEDETAALARLR
ncbi:MAG: STAS domain-containing protein [Candidatus Competibacter sp.]|nr:STAS domain-containing protein [Candidatus Competibacter sp.]MDS4070702.1 STAS domain-containing protein [Candidatus Competibacter sp.]